MRIEIEMRDRDFTVLEKFMGNNQSEEGNSHGSLDLSVLVELLLDDVVLAMRRPGSWEGENMIEVLKAHGYTV